MDFEKKLIALGDVKFAASDADTRSFSGYGAAFGNIDSYGDVIAKGAFEASLATGQAPLMFLNHDPYSLPIGVWTKLEEDDFGLKVEGNFIDTQTGRDTYTASKAGAVTGLSIGFRPIETEIVRGADGEPLRLLKSVDLLEISVVTFPANGRARIGDVKSFASADDYLRELTRLGMSAEEAKSFLSTHESMVETKYQNAVTLSVATKLLSTLKENNERD